MDRRKVALGLMVFGGLVALYFMAAFSIAAPGTSVVNQGLMNDRSNGLLFGGLMAVVGTVLYVTAPAAPQRTAAFASPAPVAPAGFWMDPNAALGYPTLSPSRSQTSLAAYRARLRTLNVSLTDPQSGWAWSHGVDAAQAGLFVGYVEAHRAWMRGAGVPGHRPPFAVPRAAYFVGGGVMVLYLVGAIVQAFPSLKRDVLSRARQVRRGQSEADALRIMGKADGCDDDAGRTEYGESQKACYYSDGKHVVRVRAARGTVYDVRYKGDDAPPFEWSRIESGD